VEVVIEEVYKDDTIAKWEAIKTDRNKLNETQRKSRIKRKPEQACDIL
jgi:hypothetical protein